MFLGRRREDEFPGKMNDIGNKHSLVDNETLVIWRIKGSDTVVM